MTDPVRFEDFRHWSMLPKTAVCLCGDPLADHRSYRKDDMRWLRDDTSAIDKPLPLDQYTRVMTYKSDGRPWIVQIPKDDGRTWDCSGTCRMHPWRCTEFVEATPDQVEFTRMRLQLAIEDGPRRFRNSVRKLLDDMLTEDMRFAIGREYWDRWVLRRAELGEYE